MQLSSVLSLGRASSRDETWATEASLHNPRATDQSYNCRWWWVNWTWCDKYVECPFTIFIHVFFPHCEQIPKYQTVTLMGALHYSSTVGTCTLQVFHRRGRSHGTLSTQCWWHKKLSVETITSPYNHFPKHYRYILWLVSCLVLFHFLLEVLFLRLHTTHVFLRFAGLAETLIHVF